MSLNLSSSFPQFNFGMINSTEHSIYVFDAFKLDRDKLMLYRDGQPLSLPPKAVETLSILAEHHGEIISKDELIEAVWTDAIVEESNLSQYLYLLRKTLGSHPDGKPYIETLRRRGYRFTADVRLLTEAPAPVGTNGANSVRKERRIVERHGNVLALVDWQESPQALAGGQPETANVPSPPQTRTWPWAITIGLVSICLIVAASATLYMSRPGASAQEEVVLEQNILRLTNGVEVIDATISPDGKYFAYHEPVGKLYRMWLQQTGQSTRHEIVPASERMPAMKTFTPDGQHIYFAAGDPGYTELSLYRVPTFGGPVTKILHGLGSGVSFSPDGREMVFARIDKDGVKYVIKSSDGGGDEKVLHSTTVGSGSAAWSPDGKWVVISLPAKSDNIYPACYLAAVKPETGSRINFSDEVWDVCGRMEWAPDGRGLYMVGTRKDESMTTRRDQLYYISYPQGKSRKVTSEGSRHQHASLGVTRDGAVIAVPFNRSSQLWAMDPGGDSRAAVQLTTGQTDGRSGIAPMADGRIAYISRIGESINIWTMNSDGSDQKQITDNPFPIEELRSGGDGRYLVFSGYVKSPRAHLFRINNDGTGQMQLTSGDGREIDSSLSNDGKWITYDSAKSVGNRNELSLWKQQIDGGERVSLGRTDCGMPHFSPDDKYISCVSDQKDILILSSEDGTLLHTLPTLPFSTLNFGARWTPDGKAVAYILTDKGISNIWLQPIDGPAKRLTDFTGGSIYNFAYSLDGKRLYVARGHQIRDAILIDE